MDAEDQGRVVAEPVGGADSGDDLGQIVGAQIEARAGAVGVALAIVAPAEIDRLHAHTRGDRPAAGGEGVLGEEGQGLGLGNPIGVAARSPEGGEDSLPFHHY